MKNKIVTLFIPSIIMIVIISCSIISVNASNAANKPLYGSENTSSVTVAEINPNYTIECCNPGDDPEISAHIIKGSPHPPVGFEAERSASAIPLTTATALPNFPSYSWVYGCGSVSAAMIAGYYDHNGFPNMYSGPTNNGLMPITDTAWSTWTDSAGKTYPNNPLIASKKGVDGRDTRGTIDNYWVSYHSTATDPYITNNWPQHEWGTAIGDFVKTSQSDYSLIDGSSVIYRFTTLPDKLTCAAMENIQSGSNGWYVSERDITYGRKLFYEARGYTVTDCYNQVTDNKVDGGFSFSDFKAEIDAGHPVFVHVAGHFMVGYGYSGHNILIRDTWDNDPGNTYSMPWGGSYQGMELLSIGIVRPALAVNHAPTDISLSSTIVREGQPKNTIVGTFYTEDPNQGDTHTYTLVSGTGSTDNNAFKIEGNQLLTNQVFDSAVKSTYRIWVRSTDQGGLWVEKQFTISVIDPSGWGNIFLPLIQSYNSSP